MTMKHIQDQIETVCVQVAFEAYTQGLKDGKLQSQGLPTPESDNLVDMLAEIVKKQLGE
jgi:hypothetical protein